MRAQSINTGFFISWRPQKATCKSLNFSCWKSWNTWMLPFSYGVVLKLGKSCHHQLDWLQAYLVPILFLLFIIYNYYLLLPALLLQDLKNRYLAHFFLEQKLIKVFKYIFIFCLKPFIFCKVTWTDFYEKRSWSPVLMGQCSDCDKAPADPAAWGGLRRNMKQAIIGKILLMGYNYWQICI